MRLGSHLRAGSWLSKARVCVQASRSAARATTSSQIRFWAIAVEGQVAQAGVLEAADAVLAAGALAVADLEGGQRPAGAAGVGGEAGDPPAVVVGQPQLGAGVGTFAAGDDPHPGRPFLGAYWLVSGSVTGVGIHAVSSATWAPSRGAPSPSSAATPGLFGDRLDRGSARGPGRETRSSTPVRRR